MEFDELDYFKIEELVVEKRIRELIAHFEALRTKGAMVEQGCVSVAVGDVTLAGRYWSSSKELLVLMTAPLCGPWEYRTLMYSIPLAYKGKYRDDRARSLLCEIYRQKTGPGS